MTTISIIGSGNMATAIGTRADRRHVRRKAGG
jgi:pyrroline-5-carboxylate reductase